MLFNLISIYWVLAAEVLFMFVCVANENNVAPVVSLVAFGALVHFFSDIHLVQFLKDNYTNCLFYSGVYLVVGVLWGFIKWWLFVVEVKEEYKQRRKVFMHKHNIIDPSHMSSPTIKDMFAREVNTSNIPPRASEHKSEITGWISYWPISVIWSLISDFVTAFFKRIYKIFASSFQRISDHSFKEFKELD